MMALNVGGSSHRLGYQLLESRDLSDGPSSAQIRPRAHTAQQPGGRLLVAEGAVLGWGLGT